MRDYNAALRAAREKAGISRAKLAELIGRSEKCVASHELNGKVPSLSYCIAVADALHISLDEMFGREHRKIWAWVTPKEWRNAYELSYDGLAKLAGVSKKTVINLESGEIDPYMCTVEAIADALGLGIDEYIKHEVK